MTFELSCLNCDLQIDMRDVVAGRGIDKKPLSISSLKQ